MEITRDAVLPVSAEEAWELVSDPSELGAWLGELSVGALRPGTSGVLVEPDGTTRSFVVDEVIDGQRVGFTWWADGSPEDASHVDVEIAEADGGALVRVTERAGARASVAGGITRLAIGSGWTGRLVDLELRALLRHTVLV